MTHIHAFQSQSVKQIMLEAFQGLGIIELVDNV